MFSISEHNKYVYDVLCSNDGDLCTNFRAVRDLVDASLKELQSVPVWSSFFAFSRFCPFQQVRRVVLRDPS